ncbi:hypothetical protein [Kibdelosporangium philippinense]|uniref:hypothetical protein n=1 Tax=Kibdelosporangium philippinense TaxID=211113 RepID=UPI003607BA0D
MSACTWLWRAGPAGFRGPAHPLAEGNGQPGVLLNANNRPGKPRSSGLDPVSSPFS